MQIRAVPMARVGVWAAVATLANSCSRTEFIPAPGEYAAALPGDVCAGYPQAGGQGKGQWQSQWVFYENGRLSYKVDGEQNRIPDYSYAGYHHGEVPLPDVPEAARVEPGDGDDTTRIQQALDRVAARKPDGRGLRGAVVLAPGRYEIAGTVRVNASGVVLRGAGDGEDPARASILLGTGNTPDGRSIVELGTGRANWPESGAVEITTPFVQVGARSFEVASTSGYRAGDEIVVRHPSTEQWIEAVDRGGVGDGTPWSAGHMDVVYFRRVASVSGNRVTLDAPVFNHLDRRLARSFIAHADSQAIREAGVENLRIDIVTAGGEDEEHARDALSVEGAHDAWVRGVTALHFRYAGIRLENAVRVTVENCRALDPVGVRTGGNFYNFASDRRAQLVLFRSCEATGGRHSFVGNGLTWTSGIVYHRCRQRNSGSEGGHRGWSTGMLYDNHDETGDTGQVLLINRGGRANPGQGWSAAHSTIWKYDGELVVQKPPTAQNYGVTSAGHFRTRFYGEGPAGVQELNSGELIPHSLYEAQLCERLAGGAPPAPPASPAPGPSLPPPPSPPPPPGPVVPAALEAEELAVETSGPRTSVETDDNSSGGQWVALNATAAGDWVKFTTPAIPAGRYRLELLWKGNTTRGIVRVRVDNLDLGAPLDQYTSGQAYPAVTFPPIVFGGHNPHVIQLEVAGKNPASSRLTLSADRFTFIRE